MAPNLLFYQLLLIALVLICLIIHVWWPDHPSAASQRPHKPDKPLRNTLKNPNPSEKVHDPHGEFPLIAYSPKRTHNRQHHQLFDLYILHLTD